MGEYKKEITLEGPATSTRELSESIVKAAQSGRGANKIPSNLSQLRLANMKLHGREDDMELLKAKLLELKKGKCEKNNKSDNSLPELVLISGVSGTGKSALVMSGVKDPAQKMGMTFVGGKFDLNNTSLPLSAFVDAMASLTKTIVEGGERKKVQDDIHDSFEEEDMIILVRALPGCEKLFPLHKECASPRRTSLTRREAISRLQYAIKMLLKIICTHLKGVVLFIDDLQVRIARQ